MLTVEDIEIIYIPLYVNFNDTVKPLSHIDLEVFPLHNKLSTDIKNYCLMSIDQCLDYELKQINYSLFEKNGGPYTTQCSELISKTIHLYKLSSQKYKGAVPYSLAGLMLLLNKIKHFSPKYMESKKTGLDSLM